MWRKRLEGHVETIGEVVKIGVPAAFSDLHHSLMEMRWPLFFLVVAATFFVLNVVFGLIYAAMPGAIAHLPDGSIVDGFFFSVDTLGTVGYGTMAPATRLGHSVAAIEIFIGIFFSAMMTGLIFSRFARPRHCLCFSPVAVIGIYQGRPTLKVRLAPIRLHTLVDARAQLSMRKLETLDDGRQLLRSIPLALQYDHNPMLGLTWTLGHFVDGSSPLVAAFERGDNITITVLVSGFDLMLASQAFGSKTYTLAEIHRDHEYVDMIDFKRDSTIVDLSKLGETIRRRVSVRAD